jgi:hypothetical protein
MLQLVDLGTSNKIKTQKSEQMHKVSLLEA